MTLLGLFNPLSLMDTSVSLMVYNSLDKYLNKYMPRNIANNYTAFFHAIGSVYFGASYFINPNDRVYYFMTKFSTGYFLYDTLHILKYKKLNFLNICYIYHHLSTVNYLRNTKMVYRAPEVLFWAELSNIPSYLVYNMMKQTKNEKQIKMLKKLQFYVYSFIRVPLITKLLYETLNSDKIENKTSIYMILPIYVMGLVWTKKLWNGL